MRSILVIGAGKFGSVLAESLEKYKNEVLLIDDDDDAVDRLTDIVTDVKIGDCTDPEIIKEIGVRDFDACFVCTASDFRASMEITSNLHDAGAHLIISKAESSRHAELLRKVGADEVIFPEKDMAERTALRFSVHGAFDCYMLAPEYAIFELAVPSSWVGKNLKQLELRTRNKVNVIGYKTEQGVIPATDISRDFTRGDHVLIAGYKSDIIALTNKN